jgi:hypothetical protein
MGLATAGRLAHGHRPVADKTNTSIHYRYGFYGDPPGQLPG